MSLIRGWDHLKNVINELSSRENKNQFQGENYGANNGVKKPKSNKWNQSPYFCCKIGRPATVLICFLFGQFIIHARERKHPVIGTLSLYSKHLKGGSHLVYFQSFNLFLKIMRIYQIIFRRLFLMHFEIPKHNDYVGDQGNTLFASHHQILVPCRQFVRMAAQSSEEQSEFGDNHVWNKATSGFNATRYHTHCLFLQNSPADFRVSDGLKIWVTKEANNITKISDLADTPFPSLYQVATLIDGRATMI